MKFNISILLPPGNPDPVTDKWQRAMATAVILLIGVQAATTAAFGSSIYALEQQHGVIHDEIAKLGKDLSDKFNASTQRIEARAIGTSIAGMHARYCDALRRKNIPEADSLSTVIAGLQQDYMMITGLPYPLGACAGL
jgi:hypothetical protein